MFPQTYWKIPSSILNNRLALQVNKREELLKALVIKMMKGGTVWVEQQEKEEVKIIVIRGRIKKIKES